LLEGKNLERSSSLTCGILRLWRQLWTQARTLILRLNFSGTGTRSKRERRSRVPLLRGRGRGATPNKEREWHILGGAERQRQGIGKFFYLNLWENLDTIDLIQSERFEHWKRKAGRIQYEFKTRITNKERYLASYHYNSSGYSQGPFNREFHKRQVIKE